jgi:hypothetical protein
MQKIGSLMFIVAATLAVCNTPARAERITGTEVVVSQLVLGERHFRTELYFGLGRKNGGAVTADEWNKFLADEVTPRFPDGLTIVEAVGQFRDASGTIVHESSRMLILLYKKKDRESAGKKIDEIRAAYCKQFDQESVLRLDIRKSVEVSF